MDDEIEAWIPQYFPMNSKIILMHYVDLVLESLPSFHPFFASSIGHMSFSLDQ